MMFLIESIVLCAFFTLTVPLYGLRDPLAMIDSYPPSIVARAEELGLVPRGRKRRAPKVIAAKLAFCLIVAVVLAVMLRIFNLAARALCRTRNSSPCVLLLFWVCALF